MKLVVLAGASALSLGACGGGSTSSGSGGTPAPTIAKQTPDLNGAVNCPTGGPSGGKLTGLGATIGAFRDTHSLQYEYADGPNQGLHEFAPRCSPEGIVLSVLHNLPAETTADQVRKNIKGSGLIPADAGQTGDTMAGPCELVTYKSAELSTIAGGHDPAGTLVVDLQGPAASSTYDPAHVDVVQLDTQVSGGC